MVNGTKVDGVQRKQKTQWSISAVLGLVILQGMFVLAVAWGWIILRLGRTLGEQVLGIWGM